MMYLTSIGTTPRRRAPIPAGPTMEVLVAAETSDNIATGERVSLTNPGTEPAIVMIVASPPELVARIAGWPAA